MQAVRMWDSLASKKRASYAKNCFGHLSVVWVILGYCSLVCFVGVSMEGRCCPGYEFLVLYLSCAWVSMQVSMCLGVHAGALGRRFKICSELSLTTTESSGDRDKRVSVGWAITQQLLRCRTGRLCCTEGSSEEAFLCCPF